MSKELELLVSSKSKSTETVSKTAKTDVKKEGNSLFDKILTQSKKELESDKTLENIPKKVTLNSSSSESTSLLNSKNDLNSSSLLNSQTLTLKQKNSSENLNSTNNKTTINLKEDNKNTNITLETKTLQSDKSVDTNSSKTTKVSLMDSLFNEAKNSIETTKDSEVNSNIPKKVVNQNTLDKKIESEAKTSTNDAKITDKTTTNISNVENKNIGIEAKKVENNSLSLEEKRDLKTENKNITTEVKKIETNISTKVSTTEEIENISPKKVTTNLKVESNSENETLLKNVDIKNDVEILAIVKNDEKTLKTVNKTDSQVKENSSINKIKEVDTKVDLKNNSINVENSEEKISLIDKILSENSKKVVLNSSEEKTTKNESDSISKKVQNSELNSVEKKENKKLDKTTLTQEKVDSSISLETNISEELVNETKINSEIPILKEEKTRLDKTINSLSKNTNISEEVVTSTKNVVENSKEENKTSETNSKKLNVEPIAKEEIKRVSLDDLMKSAKESISKTNDNESLKSQFFGNAYINSQKQAVAQNESVVKEEALKNLKNGKTTKDIEKSAKTLELNLEKQELVEESATKISTPVVEEKSSTFDRLAFLKTSSKVDETISDETVTEIKKSDSEIITKEMKSVELTVNNSLAQTIQNRIVAARQQMSSMMSDLARTMYENYKPPVTAFRVNLNPVALGSIAIVLRNEQKSNTVSVSMSVSNSSTKESMVENQSSLRESLSKVFEGNTSFTLNFDGDATTNSGDSESSFQENFLSSSEILTSKEKKEEEIKEDSLYNYM